MYGKLGSTVLAGTALAAGLTTLWHVVAATTLLAAWFALTRLFPRKQR